QRARRARRRHRLRAQPAARRRPLPPRPPQRRRPGRLRRRPGDEAGAAGAGGNPAGLAERLRSSPRRSDQRTMRRKPEAFPNHDSHAVRLAWWASFFATIAVIAILGIVRSAQAEPAPLGGAALALAPSSFETSADDESAEE